MSALKILAAVLTAAAIAIPASAQTRDDRNRDGDNHSRRNRTTTVVCESRDGRRHRCAADNALGQVTLNQQLARSKKCVEGRSWGHDGDGIWVDRGCRAEFLIVDNRGPYRDRGQSQAARTLVCESNGSQRSYCRADARFGVQMTRQISRTNCVLNRTWGSDQNGVWVSNGCRAEFTFNTRAGTR